MTHKKYAPFIIALMAPLLLGAAFQFGGIRHDITSQGTSVSPVVLSSASTQVQRFTGSTAQVVKLPDATTLRQGYWYTIINESTAALTVSTSGSTAISSLSAASQGAPTSSTFYVTSTSTTGGPWSIDPGAGGSGGGGGSSASSSITVYEGGGLGSVGTCIRYFVNSGQSQGTDITYTSSTTNGDSFTINTTGTYNVAYCDVANAQRNTGISVNASSLSTALSSLSYANGRRQWVTSSGNGAQMCVSFTQYLTAGDVVRAHTVDCTGFLSDPNVIFSISRQR